MSLVKNIFLFFCIYKMYRIPAEGHKNAGLDRSVIIKTGEKLDKNERHTKWFRCSKHF